MGISPIVDTEQTREPAPDSCERDKKANRHRQDEGNSIVNREVRPVNIQGVRQRSEKGERKADGQVDDDVVEDAAFGDFHSGVSYQPHRLSAIESVAKLLFLQFFSFFSIK